MSTTPNINFVIYGTDEGENTLRANLDTNDKTRHQTLFSLTWDWSQPKLSDEEINTILIDDDVMRYMYQAADFVQVIYNPQSKEYIRDAIVTNFKDRGQLQIVMNSGEYMGTKIYSNDFFNIRYDASKEDSSIQKQLQLLTYNS